MKLLKKILISATIIIFLMVAFVFFFYTIFNPAPRAKDPMTRELCQKFDGNWSIGSLGGYCSCPKKRIFFIDVEGGIKEGNKKKCR